MFFDYVLNSSTPQKSNTPANCDELSMDIACSANCYKLCMHIVSPGNCGKLIADIVSPGAAFIRDTLNPTLCNRECS